MVTLHDRFIVVPLPLDYLSWTESAAAEVRGLRSSGEKLKIELLCEGRASSMFRHNINRLGLELRENVDFTAK